MIRLSDINVAFGEKKVLSGLDLEFADNKVHCLLGPSGSGKTTLLNTIAGSIEYSGNISGVPGALSYVFQEPRLIPEKTVHANLDFILKRIYNKERRAEVIRKYLDMVGLEGSANLYPHELSGGMAQRVSLARAFAYPAGLILMDEPFKMLDIKLKAGLAETFFKLLEEESRTALFVTHDIDECMLLGDYVYVFSDLPLSLLKRYEVGLPREGRKLYDPKIAKLKNSIYKDIEVWSAVTT